MMTRGGEKNRGQIEFTSLEELVPEDHLVRKLEKAIDWSFIYDLVEDSYCENIGRPSLDPVILLKLPVLQYMFGIRSMRQTIQEIKVNNAYRYLKLMRISNIDERHFYEIEAAKNNWSLEELNRQYNSSLYERLALSANKEKVYQLSTKGQLMEKSGDLVKDPYVLEFLGLQELPEYSETELRAA